MTQATGRRLSQQEVSKLIGGMQVIGKSKQKKSKKIVSVLSTQLRPEVIRFMKKHSSERVKFDLEGFYNVCKEGGGTKEEESETEIAEREN